MDHGWIWMDAKLVHDFLAVNFFCEGTSLSKVERVLVDAGSTFCRLRLKNQ